MSWGAEDGVKARKAAGETGSSSRNAPAIQASALRPGDDQEGEGTEGGIAETDGQHGAVEGLADEESA